MAVLLCFLSRQQCFAYGHRLLRVCTATARDVEPFICYTAQFFFRNDHIGQLNLV